MTKSLSCLRHCKSQQPLGLALSFYNDDQSGSAGVNRIVSTAAWACIEFLLEMEMQNSVLQIHVSQQPLGLVLSFYVIVDGQWREPSRRLNSRLGLY